MKRNAKREESSRIGFTSYNAHSVYQNTWFFTPFFHYTPPQKNNAYKPKRIKNPFFLKKFLKLVAYLKISI